MFECMPTAVRMAAGDAAMYRCVGVYNTLSPLNMAVV